MGQIEARICPRTREQKVDVSHSGGARGEAAPLGICPERRIAETGNSVAQDFCNTKACRPALALWGHSQQSAPFSSQDRCGAAAFIVCLSVPCFNFPFPPHQTRWQHFEKRRPMKGGIHLWMSDTAPYNSPPAKGP